MEVLFYRGFLTRKGQIDPFDTLKTMMVSLVCLGNKAEHSPWETLALSPTHFVFATIICLEQCM